MRRTFALLGEAAAPPPPPPRTPPVVDGVTPCVPLVWSEPSLRLPDPPVAPAIPHAVAEAFQEIYGERYRALVPELPDGFEPSRRAYMRSASKKPLEAPPPPNPGTAVPRYLVLLGAPAAQGPSRGYAY